MHLFCFSSLNVIWMRLNRPPTLTKSSFPLSAAPIRARRSAMRFSAWARLKSTCGSTGKGEETSERQANCALTRKLQQTQLDDDRGWWLGRITTSAILFLDAFLTLALSFCLLFAFNTLKITCQWPVQLESYADLQLLAIKQQLLFLHLINDLASYSMIRAVEGKSRHATRLESAWSCPWRLARLLRDIFRDYFFDFILAPWRKWIQTMNT